MKRLVVPPLCALVCAVLLGCGADTSLRAGQTLDVRLTEYRINPASVQLPAGSVTITVHNFGRLTHDLVVAQGTHWLASTHPLWPGQSTTMTVQLPAGNYTMFSALLSDQALGQYGSLTAK